MSSLDPPDFRGEEVYRLEFTLLDKEQKIRDGFTHRYSTGKLNVAVFTYLWTVVNTT